MDTMNALVWKGDGALSLERRPIPALQGPRDAIVRVTRSTICTSDLHIRSGAVPRARPGVVLGHEFVGVVPGAGISCFACSEANMAYMEKLLTVQVISFDKVNQQRHVLYLKDKAHTLELMKKHAAIMGPKFRCVVDALDREIAPLEIASWRRPKGGYFVSLNAMPGTAKRTLALCKEAGVTMTGAGATFPYGKDPQDSNIRIAPSLPPVEELEQAIAVLCVCLKMAALEKLGV